MWAEKAETSSLGQNVAPTKGDDVGDKGRRSKEHKLHVKAQSKQEEGLTSSEKRKKAASGLGMEGGKQNRGDRKSSQDRAIHRDSVLSDRAEQATCQEDHRAAGQSAEDG